MPSSSLLQRILQQHSDWFGPVLKRADAYQLQVLYKQIDRDEENRPRFTSHTFGVDPETYFYPASTVKMPAAFLALEKLRQLGIPGLDRDTPVRIDAAASGQIAVLHDPSAPDGLPTIGHYIRKIFLVSDNDANNRLYEFLGQQALNEKLWEKGYRNLRLLHRLSLPRSAPQNARTNPMTFYDADSRATIYEQPLACNENAYLPESPILLGDAHHVEGERVEAPMDFSGKNWIAVAELQAILKAVLFPESVDASRRFDLGEDDLDFLYRAMSQLPRESAVAKYADEEHYYDSYVKFALFGDSKDRIEERIRLFNKVGLAYGFMTENAYVVDFDRGLEYLLTAVICVNENRVFNDGEYAYDDVGFPFMANLGRAIHLYERGRERSFIPDLSRFTPYR